jgi:hypothetical protein
MKLSLTLLLLLVVSFCHAQMPPINSMISACICKTKGCIDTLLLSENYVFVENITNETPLEWADSYLHKKDDKISTENTIKIIPPIYTPYYSIKYYTTDSFNYKNAIKSLLIDGFITFDDNDEDLEGTIYKLYESPKHPRLKVQDFINTKKDSDQHLIMFYWREE